MDGLEIGKKEILSRVSRYQLRREDIGERIFIDVHEIIAVGGGEAKKPFVAVPNMVVQDAGTRYVAKGASEQEALSNCLKLISGIPFCDVMAKD